MNRFAGWRPSPATIISLVALFVALGGTSYAAVVLTPRNSVNSASVINGSLQKVDLSRTAVAALRGNRGARGVPGTPGAQGATGAVGPVGPPGPATGPAGGALVGNYPNPTLAAMEPWHEIGAPGEPAFLGGWKNTGGVLSTAAYAKDSLGFVHLKGVVSPGPATSSTAVFNLPAGYRPAHQSIVSMGNQPYGVINPDVYDGVVVVIDVDFAGLDGITFKAG